MVSITSPLVITMIIYFGLTLLIAFWSGRETTGSYEMFTMADRNLSLPVYTMTYFATFVGGGLTMGIAQQAFLRGISAQWYAMTQGLAWITIALVIGFLYSFDVVSVPELLGWAFGKYTKYFAALFTVIGLVALTAAQTIAMATVMVVLLDISLQLAFWASTLVFIGITFYGGMNSVAWADTLHGIIIIVGMFTAIPLAVLNVGGWDAITAAVPASHLNWFGVGLVQIASWYLLYLTVAGAQQQMLQRTWAAKSERVAMIGTFISGLLIAGYGVLTATGGLIAAAQGANIDSAFAFAWTIKNTLPPVFGGLLLAATVGAIMSSADSFLLSGATSFVNDIYIPARGGRDDLSETHLVAISRATILVFGIGAAVIALSGVRIIAIDSLGIGVMSVLFAGVATLHWEKTTRESGLPGFIVGGIVFVIWDFVLDEPSLFGEGPLESAVVATAAALLTIVVLSLGGYGERFDITTIRREMRMEAVEHRDVPEDD